MNEIATEIILLETERQLDIAKRQLDKYKAALEQIRDCAGKCSWVRKMQQVAVEALK